MIDYNERVRQLGLEIPGAAAPAGLYTPWVLEGTLLHVSGQLSLSADVRYEGPAGPQTDLATAQAAARVCGLNLLGQIRAALGNDLRRVHRVLKLSAFVCVRRGFGSIPAAADGCSQLFIDLFGEVGRHARVAVGVPELPRGAMIEIDALLAVRPHADQDHVRDAALADPGR